ncbi:bifunctional phosphoribosyl-AMP cyclohydrolase/phosphoribosyl-ATP diphosphatase HisIE [soil metagenome]
MSASLPDFAKGNGLLPAIIQDAQTANVLMLGFMNEEAYDYTLSSGRVTFYSRSKERLWTKGETSGNFLVVESITLDCDLDTFLVKANPQGPTCHTGSDTCFNESNDSNIHFLALLQTIIESRKTAAPESSYTASLFAKGTNKIAQKVGEEAVELVIEAKDSNNDLFLGEAADLLFHYMIRLSHKGFSLQDVIKVLQERHK